MGFFKKTGSNFVTNKPQCCEEDNFVTSIVFTQPGGAGTPWFITLTFVEGGSITQQLPTDIAPNIDIQSFARVGTTDVVRITESDGTTFDLDLSFLTTPGVFSHLQEENITNVGGVTLANPLAIANNTVVSFVTKVTAFEKTTGDAWAKEYTGVIKQISGVTSLVGVVNIVDLAYDAGAAAFLADFTAGAGTLDIAVTSGSSNEVKWNATTTYNELTLL